jgi:ubiquinone/menaquinone biosynthesis C-methylase UbiE
MAAASPPTPTPAEIRDANVRYHDVAAESYDAKWGIDFGAGGRAQVLGKVRRALGHEVGTYADALEIGAGTGYVALNLLLSGHVERATCTDVAPGMLAVLDANADRLGLADRVTTVATDAERLPFADGSFDLVVGHAVLHHLPDLGRAFAELHRVLRPGGVVVFAGEPSRIGDRIAAYPKRAASRVAPLWRRALRVREAAHHGHHGEADPGLEQIVDVHAFTPGDLTAHARAAGLADVRVVGEELLANWFGWTNRTLESTADMSTVPWLWIQYAFRGYLLLQQVDQRLLEGRLPPALFYNLLVSARRPA